jgi:hypothetical protein
MFYVFMLLAMSMAIFFIVRSASILVNMVMDPESPKPMSNFGTISEEIDKVIDHALRYQYSQAVNKLALNGDRINHAKVQMRATRMAHRRLERSGLINPGTEIQVVRSMLMAKIDEESIKRYIDEA